MTETTKLDPATILDSALELDGEVAPYYSYFDTSRGTPLSVTNMLTLYMQGADEIVGTRSQWANVGHTPKPDAQRYYIWIPLFAKRPKEVALRAFHQGTPTTAEKRRSQGPGGAGIRH